LIGMQFFEEIARGFGLAAECKRVDEFLRALLEAQDDVVDTR